MSTIERITITLTVEMAQAVRGAVQAGEYGGDHRFPDGCATGWASA
jgi:hypothetical protein